MYQNNDPRGRVTKDDLIKEAEKLGVTLVWDQEIQPGDMYLAGRNGPVEFLTCKRIHMDAVFPVGLHYPYDLHECCKIAA